MHHLFWRPAIASLVVGSLIAFPLQGADAPGYRTDFPVKMGKIARGAPDESERAKHAPFAESAPEVDAKQAGLVGDGRTDNTDAFKKLFATPGRTVRIPAGDYLTGKLSIPADTTVQLAAGTTIRDNGKLGTEDVMITIAGNHVRILGSGNSVIRADRAAYTTGEWRHGISIFGVSDVIIKDLKLIGTGGDAIYIGGPIGHPSTDITIRAVVGDNNRRQGLSITNARRVDVIKCEFMNTNGTPPAYGVDLEPNHPEDFLDGILILSARTIGNQGGGILVSIQNLNAKSPPMDIVVIDHKSAKDKYVLRTGGTASTPGVIRYVQYQ